MELYIDLKCTLLETARCENRALDLDNYLLIKFLLHLCHLSCWNYAIPVYRARVLLIRTGIYISSLTETTGVNNATNPTGTNGSVSPKVLQMVTYRLPASHNIVFSYVSGSQMMPSSIKLQLLCQHVQQVPSSVLVYSLWLLSSSGTVQEVC